MEELLKNTCDSNNSVLKTLFTYLDLDREDLKEKVKDIIIKQIVQNENTCEAIKNTLSVNFQQ